MATTTFVENISGPSIKYDDNAGELMVISDAKEIKAQVKCIDVEIASITNEPMPVWLPNGIVIQQTPEIDVEICVRFAVRHDEDCPFKPILLCVEKEK